jgi:hypothetical protein
MEDPQAVESNETSTNKPDNESEETEQREIDLDSSFKHDPNDSNGEEDETPVAGDFSNDQAELVNGLKAKLDLNKDDHVNGVSQNGDHVNGNAHNGENGTDEKNDDNKQEESHEESFSFMKNSQSNEFTYTSLGSNRPDDLDEDKPEEKKQELRIESVELTLNKEKEAVKVKTEPDAESTFSDDSIKKLPFDEIIDRVRTNSIANKEVCNYVLNLLVGGEFDLEKNFVIQNINSILNMIQVIKCARPALKVNFTNCLLYYE